MANPTNKNQKNVDPSPVAPQPSDRTDQQTSAPKLRVIQGGAAPGRKNEDAAEGEDEIIDEALKNQAPQGGPKSSAQK